MPRKKKTKREQESGLAEYKASLGKNPATGKLIRKSFYGKDLPEAKEKADEYRLALRMGTLDKERIGFEDWCKKWLTTYKKDVVKGSTYYLNYLNNVNNHFVPHFQNTSLELIKQIDVQAFFNSKKDYSQHMLKKMRGTLHSIFESAVDNELINRNPVRNIKLPPGKPSEVKKTYSKEQADKVIEFCKSHEHGIGPLIVLKTGVRRGELMGLKWSDFDMESKTLHLQRAVADVVVDDKYQQVVSEGDEATKNHVRDIPFDDDLKDYLEKVKKVAYNYRLTRLKRRAKRHGLEFDEDSFTLDDEYIFLRRQDQVQSPNNYGARHYSYFLEALLKKHPDLEPLGLHELRHTYGTLLRERGVDIYTIQKVMGHADVNITSSIYVHNDIDVLRKSMMME